MQARSIICTKHGVKKTFGNRCLTIKTKTKMKKNLFMVAAVALMAMVSCNKEEVNQSGPEVAPEPSYYVEFTAQIDNEETPAPAQTQTQTRTAYDETNKTTKWIDGDLISVNGKRFKIKELAADGLSATFINDEELGEDFGAPFTAIYPYNATEGSAVVPSTQTVTDGTFADESVVTVAYSADNNTLSFKHVTSVVKFQVATEGVSELTFSSSVALAGTISVNANEGGEPTYEATAGSKTITVKPESGTFSVGETYYVSVLPTVGEAETKVDFAIKTEGVTVKSGNVNFKRNVVMDAKSIQVNYTFLKPNANWILANARFAAYFFEGESNLWVDMKAVDGIYRCVVPQGYTNVIYGRMNPSSSANGWTENTQLWNKTSDLKVQTTTTNCYVVHIEEWNEGKGLWLTVSDAKRILYLLPTAEWDKDNARFAAYFYGNGEKWVSMTKYDATNSRFYVIPPAGYPNVIFCRMNGDTSTNNWDNRWNQTENLTIPTNGNNTCEISDFWNGNGAKGTWSKK